MRVVLDTNILLSALISPSGPPEAIYRAWRAGVLDLVTSEYQLEEIRRASRYPILRSRFKPASVGTLINFLRQGSVLGRLELTVEANDPSDSFLLAMALESDADYLVTGDRRAGLLEMKHIKRTRIVTPIEFQVEVLK